MQFKCRWHPTGREIVYIISTEDLEKVDEHNFDTLDSDTKGLLKAITTSCRAMGRTEEAAKYARQKHFAMLDYFELNSLFLRYNTR